MTSVLEKAINSVQSAPLAMCKFITANDAGATGAHQSGYLIPKGAWAMFFDSPGAKGSNKDVFVKIRWQDSIETDSRCIYYGQKTRNEYRLTRFGKGFPYLQEDSVGDLLIIAKKGNGYYEGFVLETDEEMEDFFNAFGISATETNGIIPKSRA
jgi:type II restriction enzyme